MSVTSDRRVLDEAGGFGAMTGVMATMLFLTVLAAGLGLGTAAAARLLDRDVAGRVTVQVVDGDSGRRDRAAARVTAALRATPGVTRVVPVDAVELARMLEPWLGAGAAGSDNVSSALPIPALIDVTLADGQSATLARAADAARRASPAVQVDRHANWMSPVSVLMRSLLLLALGLVLLMVVVTAGMVALMVRAGLQTHRATIDVMHMLGATDVQVARLFQRRIAIDTAAGGAIGGAVALGVTLAFQFQLAGIGSELLGGAILAPRDWLVLALLPAGFVLLAMLAARVAVLRAMRRVL
jgi:cell division transport system permease protein